MKSTNPGTYLKYVCCTALLAAPILSPALAEDELCNSLSIIRASASEDFASVRGPSKSNDKWAVKVSLPGFVTCELSTLPDGNLIYTCQGEMRPRLKAASTEASRFGERLAACFGGDATTMNNDMGEAGTMVTIFPTDGKAHFLVSSMMTFDFSQQPSKKVWVVNFQMSRPVDPESLFAKESDSEPALPKELPSTDEICPLMLKVVTAAEDKFKSIQGKGNKTDGWGTNTKLPGFRRCSIDVLGQGRYYYSCDVSSTSDESVARTDLENVVDLVAECLGAAWEHEERKTRSGSSVEFWKSDFDPTVDLRLSEPSFPGDDWDLRFDVDMPE